MRLFNIPIKVACERAHAFQKKLADWLQRKANAIPLRTQQLILLIVCMLVTVYCVLLILQPLIN